MLLQRFFVYKNKCSCIEKDIVFQIWIYRFDKAMQTNPLVTLVLIILLNEIIASLLSSNGEQGKFRFFPYPPLATPQSH